MLGQRLMCLICGTAVVYDTTTVSITCACTMATWMPVSNGKFVPAPDGSEFHPVVKVLVPNPRNQPKPKPKPKLRIVANG